MRQENKRRPIPLVINIAKQGEVSHIWKDGERMVGDYERNIVLEKYKKGGEE